MVAATLAAGSAPTSRAAASDAATSRRPFVAAEARWVSPPAVLAIEDDSVYYVDGEQLVAGRILDPADARETGRSAPFGGPGVEPEALEVRSGLAWLAWAEGDAHHLTVFDVSSVPEVPRPLATAALPCRPVRLRPAAERVIVQCHRFADDQPLVLVELGLEPTFQLTLSPLTDLPTNITAFDWQAGRLAILDRPLDGWPRLTWYAALDPRQPHARGQLEIRTRIATDVQLTGAYALVRHAPISAVADFNAYDLADPAGPRQLGTWRLGLGGPVDLAVLDAKTVIALDPTRRRLWAIDLEAPAAASETELLELPACAAPAAHWMAARDGRVLIGGACWPHLIQPAHDLQTDTDFVAVWPLTFLLIPPDRTPLGAMAALRGALVAATRAGIALAAPQPDGRLVHAPPLPPLGQASATARTQVVRMAASGERLWVGLSGEDGAPVRAAARAGDDGLDWIDGAEIGTWGDTVTALAFDGQRLVFSTHENGPQLYDVADPSRPRRLSVLRSEGPPVFPDVDDVAFAGKRVAAAMGGHLHVWRIDDPTAPVWLGATPSAAVRLATAGDRVVGATPTGLAVYDIAGNGAPTRIGALDDLEPPPGAAPVDVGIAAGAVDGAPIVAYRSGGQRVRFIDLSDPADPREFAVRQVPDAGANRSADAFLAGPAFDTEGGDVYVAGWQRWYRYSVGAVPVVRTVVLPWLVRGGS